MGTYIYCGEEAKHPFTVKPIGLCLYSAEELCYYINNNMTLADEELICPELMDFLGKELGMTELAERIRRCYTSEEKLASVLLIIMREVSYYNDQEIRDFQERFSEYRKKTPAERKLEKADRLAEIGLYEHAIRTYMKILEMHRDARKSSDFFSTVLQHMGSACIQLGLYEEGQECLTAAWKEKKNPRILKQLYFLAMETGKNFPKELENTDAKTLVEWQGELNGILSSCQDRAAGDGQSFMFYETEERRKELVAEYLGRQKKEYRRMSGNAF